MESPGDLEVRRIGDPRCGFGAYCDGHEELDVAKRVRERTDDTED